ncbi:hypothetical protein GT347_20630 [Xylophilus rhododendri]|uniref:Lipoprotein n=1 Tax=Xylophilus rhododendri TaxID=2697032 RepID=A0A857JFP3_9BURK|nr:hypothetical protein GT347_20630 [Xylophilus rhododendri]
MGFVLASAACSTSTSASIEAARSLFSPPAADTAVLNPAYRYLRVTAGKNVALLVLGYTDATPGPGTEVWYSASKEAVRLWQGRIAGTGGLKTDWHSVRFDGAPSWRSALAGGARYRRLRDVMPGYATDVREEVWVSPIAPPASSSLKNLAPESLQWFEERTVPQGLASGLPAARFAVDLSSQQERVVYSEQCLSPDFCITTQIWPATPTRLTAS